MEICSFGMLFSLLYVWDLALVFIGSLIGLSFRVLAFLSDLSDAFAWDLSFGI